MRYNMNKVEPTRDLVFKRIFGKVGNEEILKEFLEAILETEIDSVELDLDKDMEPEYEEDKKNILDVRAKINGDTNINIEMQIRDNKDMEKRSLYHWSKLYLHELKKGMPYDKLPKTIVIVIAKYIVFEDMEAYHTKWMLRENKVKDRILTDVEEIHFIEIPKFKNMNVKNMKKLDFWLWFLDYTNKEMVKMATEKELAIRRAVEELDRLTADPRLQRILDAEELARMDEDVLRRQAIKQGLEEGRKEGRKEGMKEGMEKGMEKGIEQGKKQNQIETAKKLKEKGISIDIIAEATELSKEEIEKL